MSVASRNPFSLLDDQDSSRPASPAPAKPAAAPAAPAPAAPRGQQKPKASPASRGGKYYARGGKPAAKDGSAAPAAEDAPVDGQKKFEGGRGARPGRGRGGAARGGRRAFDKHSATGKTDSQKKVHQGWGGDEGNTELKQEQAADADAAAEVAPAVEGEAAPAEGAATPRKAREEEEEEDNTLTLEQYAAQQKAKEPTVPQLEGIRQANEGAGDDLWKGAVALNKEEAEVDYFVGKAKSAPKTKAKKEEKVFLEIDARFERPDRGAGRGRGRGDRGGDRARGGERRGRGAPGAPRAPRGGRQNGPAAPNVDDQTAFPSLA